MTKDEKEMTHDEKEVTNTQIMKGTMIARAMYLVGCVQNRACEFMDASDHPASAMHYNAILTDVAMVQEILKFLLVGAGANANALAKGVGEAVAEDAEEIKRQFSKDSGTSNVSQMPEGFTEILRKAVDECPCPNCTARRAAEKKTRLN